MAIKDIIGAGVGFVPGAVKFIVTRGLSMGAAASYNVSGHAVWAGGMIGSPATAGAAWSAPVVGAVAAYPNLAAAEVNPQ